jgi:hypothetical protein
VVPRLSTVTLCEVWTGHPFPSRNDEHCELPPVIEPTGVKDTDGRTSIVR